MLKWKDITSSQMSRIREIWQDISLSSAQRYEKVEKEFGVRPRTLRDWNKLHGLCAKTETGTSSENAVVSAFYLKENVSAEELWGALEENPESMTVHTPQKTEQLRRAGVAAKKGPPDPEKIWRHFEALHDEMSNLSAVHTFARMEITAEKPIGLVFLSDVHIGGRGTDHARLRRDIETIANTDGLYVYWGGDSMDNFILGGKMMAASREQIAQPDIQWVLFEYILKKIAHKIVAIGTGNHEAWSEAIAGIDGVSQLADKLNLVYTKHGGVLDLQVGRESYRIMRRHRFPYESNLNLTHAIKRMYDMGPVSFDVGVLEDRHQPALESFTRHPWDRGGRDIVALRPGTYKINDAYAASQGYYHGMIANPVLIFHPNTWRIDTFKHMEPGIEILGLLRNR